MMRISEAVFALALMLCSGCAAALNAETPAAESQEPVQQTSDSQTEENVMNELCMKINDEILAVEWENNESTAFLKTYVQETPIRAELSMYGGFEQVGSLGIDVPRNDVQITTESGDIMLYSGNQIVVFFGSNSWSYTRLGHIVGKTAEGMKELLGNGDVQITLYSGE